METVSEGDIAKNLTKLDLTQQCVSIPAYQWWSQK